MTDKIEITEIALVTNMQSTGPMFLSNAIGLISSDMGMLLAARLIITAGIGNTSSKTMELYGPLPVPELSENEYSCYLLSADMKQKPIPGSSFSTGKGTIIFCVIFKSEMSEKLFSHKSLIEQILVRHSNILDFSDSITGEISSEIQTMAKEILISLFETINSSLETAEKYKGASLFDIAFLVTLPEKLSILGKQLIHQPDGWLEEEIKGKESLDQLLIAGLVRREDRNGQIWLIPL